MIVYSTKKEKNDVLKRNEIMKFKNEVKYSELYVAVYSLHYLSSFEIDIP